MSNNVIRHPICPICKVEMIRTKGNPVLFNWFCYRCGTWVCEVSSINKSKVLQNQVFKSKGVHQEDKNTT